MNRYLLVNGPKAIENTIEFYYIFIPSYFSYSADFFPNRTT